MAPQIFEVKDLPTKSVTLYPSRAHIVRNIPDIQLAPGLNEIEIHGLAPAVDEQSVQIEGRGKSVTITDITVDLVPNKEEFEDVYPSESESEEDSSDEESCSDDDIPTVKALSKEIKELSAKLTAEEDRIGSVDQQFATLQSYFSDIKVKECTAEALSNALAVYEKERDRLFGIRQSATDTIASLTKQRARKESERKRANKEPQRAKVAALKEKNAARWAARRQREELRREARRVRAEHEKFWPLKTYRIKLNLESAVDTPAGSRRGSIGSVTLSKNSPEELDEGTEQVERNVSLQLSYVTTDAFWTPRYDIDVSSVNKTASITYRAELSNHTSETWRDAKVSLSTSQTSFSGLDDKPPTMNVWNVKLGYSADGDALLNAQEVGPGGYMQRLNMKEKNMGAPSKKMMWMARQQYPEPAQAGGGGVFGSSNTTGLFGNSNAAPPPPQQAPAMAMYSAQQMAPISLQHQQQQLLLHEQQQKIQLAYAFQDAPHPSRSAPGASSPSESAIDFQESTWEDYGLTATYEIPGTRTLAPSSLARRHKIVTLTATNIVLSHIAVPKLRASAFLRARVRNPSSAVTLLRGNAGVTLDGSFLGNTVLTRVAPGQTFILSLGVDPALHVSYTKPTVHRATLGFLSKESSHQYTRSVILTNNKSTPVELLVLDQVPVSQDERLKIEILEPRGLGREGDAVKTGGSAVEGRKEWGRATAVLKKGGEIAFNVSLGKGQACVLKLEYGARMPSGETMTLA
ncbi:hypothetical protein EJ06DRAFT_501063 [Trichodelitschia bisporula]|uniref:DUF4139 domain-containing protein n=1 Tax=Trichodelitschia bisporula TaxID=703511 RepID=A0A6G1HJ45_9PEZI|nr:hypothetical protein EJ06DRAFT_501063 [Trichodelitschia bisporula]